MTSEAKRFLVIQGLTTLDFHGTAEEAEADALKRAEKHSMSFFVAEVLSVARRPIADVQLVPYKKEPK